MTSLSLGRGRREFLFRRPLAVVEEDSSRQRRRWRFDANGKAGNSLARAQCRSGWATGEGRLDKKLTRGEIKDCQEGKPWEDESDEASKRNMEEMRDARRRRRKGCGVWQRNEVWEEEEIWGRLGVSTGQQADRPDRQDRQAAPGNFQDDGCCERDFLVLF